MKRVRGVFLLTSLMTANAPALERNLVVNSDLSAGKDRSVPGWTFLIGNSSTVPSEESAKVDWGVRGEGAEKSLFVSVATHKVQIHAWWYQKIKVRPGTSYVYSYRAKGSVFSNQAKWFGVSPTIVFFGPDNKFLGAVSGPGKTNAVWSLYSGHFFVPRGVESVDLRLTLNSLGAHETLEASFKDVEILPQGSVIPE